MNLNYILQIGTVTTVKNMFEQQIRLSRYDHHRSSNTPTPVNLRMNNQHRELLSPDRSRSISPNDMAVRQRRTPVINTSIQPSTSSKLIIPVSTSYPDLVISHTPTKSLPTETHTMNNQSSVSNMHKENKIKSSSLNIVADDCSTTNSGLNSLLPTNSSSDNVDSQSLDFKSRLALFNRKNTNERTDSSSSISSNMKTLSNHLNSSANCLTKPTFHHHSEKNDMPIDSIARSVINTTKPVTFFGGTKINTDDTSTLPPSIVSPSSLIIVDEQLSISNDSLRPPDIIGGNVKLAKSSIFSGMKKVLSMNFDQNSCF